MAIHEPITSALRPVDGRRRSMRIPRLVPVALAASLAACGSDTTSGSPGKTDRGGADGSTSSGGYSAAAGGTAGASHSAAGAREDGGGGPDTGGSSSGG